MVKPLFSPQAALICIVVGVAITVAIPVYQGCGPPDDDKLIDVVDGVIHVKHTLDKEDTPGVASGRLASTAYTLAFKYPDALRIEYTIYWPTLGPNQSTGVISVNTLEMILIRQTSSTSQYKQDRAKDYKVAVYEACTPLALKCTAAQIHEIIKYRRSAAYNHGISGISNVERPLLDTFEEHAGIIAEMDRVWAEGADDPVDPNAKIIEAKNPAPVEAPTECPWDLQTEELKEADKQIIDLRDGEIEVELLVVGDNILRLDHAIGPSGIQVHGANCPQRAAYTKAVSNIIAAEIIAQGLERLAIAIDPEDPPIPFGPGIVPVPSGSTELPGISSEESDE
jgi:hypothetical protein